MFSFVHCTLVGDREMATFFQQVTLLFQVSKFLCNNLSTFLYLEIFSINEVFRLAKPQLNEFDCTVVLYQQIWLTFSLTFLNYTICLNSDNWKTRAIY